MNLQQQQHHDHQLRVRLQALVSWRRLGMYFVHLVTKSIEDERRYGDVIWPVNEIQLHAAHQISGRMLQIKIH